MIDGRVDLQPVKSAHEITDRDRLRGGGRLRTLGCGRVLIDRERVGPRATRGRALGIKVQRIGPVTAICSAGPKQRDDVIAATALRHHRCRPPVTLIGILGASRQHVVARAAKQCHRARLVGMRAGRQRTVAIVTVQNAVQITCHRVIARPAVTGARKLGPDHIVAVVTINRRIARNPQVVLAQAAIGVGIIAHREQGIVTSVAVKIFRTFADQVVIAVTAIACSIQRQQKLIITKPAIKAAAAGQLIIADTAISQTI